MNIFHGIFCYGPHNSMVRDQCDAVDAVIECTPAHRFVYYGTETVLPTEDQCHPEYVHVLQMRECYENLPLKTFGMLKHALTFRNWDRLLKTDVNSRIGAFDAKAAVIQDLIGYCAYRENGRKTISRNYHAGRCADKILDDPWMDDEPFSWIGGPAYMLSRRLAAYIVSKGAWWARSWPYEDIMVSAAADEIGHPAAPGIGYYSDQDNFSCLHLSRTRR